MGSLKRENKIGTIAAFAAYGAWGLFPLYWKALASVEPLQILAHRILWAFVFTGVLLMVRREFGTFIRLLADWRMARYAVLASLLITANWGIYIWAVNAGHVTESSLGYYINPLVSVGLGAIFLGERLDRFTVGAVVLAGAGVAVASIMMGTPPWISLALAGTFGFYGLLKKKAAFAPLHGLAAETLIVTPLALGFLAWRHGSGSGAFLQGNTLETVLLAFSGLVTAMPLLCFALAANRISLQRMGFIQYLSPTLQLSLGVLVYGERPSRPMVVAFATVIGAVALYAMTRKKALALDPAEQSGP